MVEIEEVSPLLSASDKSVTVKSLLETVNKHVKASGGEAMLQSKDDGGNVCGTDKERDMEYAEFKLRTATNAKIVAALKPDKKLVWAIAQKDAGNCLYRDKKFDEAIAKYLDALVGLELSVEELRAGWSAVQSRLCNLAACYVHTQRWAKVEPLCTEAIKLNPSSVKARTRRAQARAANHDFDGALKDLRDADDLEKGCADKLRRRVRAMKQGEARRKRELKAYRKMLEKDNGGLYADKRQHLCNRNANKRPSSKLMNPQQSTFLAASSTASGDALPEQERQKRVQV